MIRRYVGYPLLATLLVPALALAREGCQVIDLMSAYEATLTSGGTIENYRNALTRPHPDIYRGDYVNALLATDFTDGESRSLAWARDHLAEVEASRRLILQEAPERLERFGRSFPKFRCDFTFYAAPSFGHLDGSAAVYQGKPLIVFAPDTIPRLHEPPVVRVLIDHEIFHVYHAQASRGAFGSFAIGVPRTYQSLWSEGMAVYASWQANPSASLDDALLSPDLRAQAEPNLRMLAAALRDHLDDSDPAFFAQYFTGGSHPPHGPPRSGYYIGLRVVQALAMRYPLTTLAEMDEAKVRALVRQQLDALARSKEAGLP